MIIGGLAYRHARKAYQRVLNRPAWASRTQLREFFRPFVNHGALAFDIGACYGDVAEAFYELGVRVVAVEPNPILADRLRRIYPFTVVAAAVGSTPGHVTLHVGRDASHSTVSSEWLERAPSENRWLDQVPVRQTTLDALIDEHGRPDFIKIDVEGYEAEVLAGLSFAPPALSFEFQCAAPNIAAAAVAKLDALNTYRFALTLFEDRTLWTPWGSGTVVLEKIRQLSDDAPGGYGDVIARRVGTDSTS